MTLQKNVLSSSLSGGVTFALKVLFNVMTIPLIIHHLGANAYGVYLLFVSLGETLSFLDFGMGTGLTQQLAENSDRDKKAHLLAFSHTFLMLVSCIFFAFGLQFQQAILHLLSLPRELNTTANGLFPFLLLDGAINLYGRYFQAVLKSHCKHYWNNHLELIQSIAINGGAIALLCSGHGLWEVFLLRLLLSGLKTGFLLVQARKEEPDALGLCFQFETKAIAPLGSISLFAMLQDNTLLLARRVDDILVARFLGVGALASFGLLTKCFSYIELLCLRVTETLFPAFTNLQTASLSHRQQFFLQSSRWIHNGISLALLLLLCFFPEIIQCLSMNQIQGSTLWLSAVGFSILAWSSAIQIPAAYLLFASRRYKIQACASSITELLNIGLSCLLLKPFGLFGLILSTVITHLMQHQLISIRNSLKLLQISQNTYWKALFPGSTWPLVILALSFSLMRILYQGHIISFPVLVSLATGSIISSSWVYAHHGLSQTEKTAIQCQFKRLFFPVAPVDITS